MDKTLTHHGTKGMRWGIRRYQNKDGSLTPAGKKRHGDYHEDYTNAHTKKNVKTMSNTELKERNKRLQMEQDYARLSQTRSSAGRKWVAGVLVGVATSLATTYASKYAKQGIEYVGKAASSIIKK